MEILKYLPVAFHIVEGRPPSRSATGSLLFGGRQWMKRRRSAVYAADSLH